MSDTQPQDMTVMNQVDKFLAEYDYNALFDRRIINGYLTADDRTSLFNIIKKQVRAGIEKHLVSYKDISIQSVLKIVEGRIFNIDNTLHNVI